MRLILALAAFSSVACGKGDKTTVVTSENILGAWVLQCRTKARDTVTCNSQEARSTKSILGAGGKLKQTTDGFDACTTSSWTLSGAELEYVCRGGGLTLRERWNARLVGERLVLWNPDYGGRVLVREGTPAPEPKGVLSSDADIKRTLGDVEYSVRLPAGYFLAEETSVSDRFDSKKSTVTYRFKVSGTARPVGERGSCAGHRGELERDSDGAMRIACIDKPSGVFTLSCWARSSGHFSDDDFGAAKKVCGSLKLR